METLKFKGDSATRRRFFTKESFAHPAKMASGLFLECLDRYTHPGDVVLDPMAGSGTALLGAMYGRTMVLNELELHFILPMLASWRKIQAHGPALGHTMGQAVILRGDARALPLCSADSIITSPPYEGMNDEGRRFGGIKDPTANSSGSIGRIALRYTRPQVDAVVSSPPFQDQEPFADKQFMLDNGKGHNAPYRPVSESRPSATAYSATNGDNIGNQRGEAYWASMRQVYAECWRVLRPGGIMALVLKGFTRDGQYVDLPGQTEALLLAARWEPHDHWRRELWSLSFWRILQKRRDPAAFDERLNYEEVLAVRKPGAAGEGMAAVLTSPPYEGITGDGKEIGSQGHATGAFSYTRPVDAIISSPPYEGLSFTGDSKESQSKNEGKWGRKFGPAYSRQSYTKEVK